MELMLPSRSSYHTLGKLGFPNERYLNKLFFE